MLERFKVKPDEVLVFESDGKVNITIHGNIKPKLVRVKDSSNKYKYEDWYEAECNSFTANVDDIDWITLFETPNKYLDFKSTINN